MDIDALLKARDEILAIAHRHGASNVRALLDHAQLQIDLEALLGRKVDVITARGLRPHLRDRVLQEAIPL